MLAFYGSVRTIVVSRNFKTISYMAFINKFAINILHLFILQILIWFLFPASLTAQKQDIHFSQLTVKDGLSQSTVNCIVQDYRGFIWISTSNGLNRYDGTNFKVYKHDPRNDESLSDNAPGCIFEDSKKRLWVSTIGKGLNLYNRDKDNWKRFYSNPEDPNTLSSNDISWIIEDVEPGNLWIATYNGLNYFNDKSQTFHRFMSDDKSNIFQDKNVTGSLYRNDVVYLLKSKNEDCIWIGYGNKIGRFLIKENRFELFDLYFKDQKLANTTTIYSITEDSSNKLWIGTEGYGLFQFDQFEKRFKNIEYPDGTIHQYSVKTIFEDNQNQLWIGYNGEGLGCFNLKTGNYSNYKENNNLPYSLSNNTIYSIFQSKDGILWFGTYGDGLNILDQKKSKFELYRNVPYEVNSLSNSHVRDIFEDDDGIIWLGTRKGIDLFNPNTKSISQFKFNKGIADVINTDIVLTITKDDNKVMWIGTFSNGLFSYNPKNQSVRQYLPITDEPASLSNQHVYKIYIDSKKTMWVGTLDGLNKLAKGETGFQRYDIKGVIDISEDKKGNIWIGSSHGLYYIENGRGNPVRIWPSKGIEQVYCVFTDDQNDIWIGTGNNGLIRFEKDHVIEKQYTTQDGLPENKIFGILEDKIGNLWLSTDHGLSKFDKNTSLFKNFDENDGLQGNEFYSNSYLKASDGKLYFGGLNGFNAFYPEQIIENDFIPEIVFTDFKLFNKEVPVGTENSPLTKVITETDEITLSYKQNVFSVDFASLNYTSPGKNQYAYFLEGFDSEETGWNYIGHNHTATYTNLPAGRYVLKVIGSNNDLKWNEEGIALKIRITPPIWKTWQAGIIYFLMIVGMILLFMRFTIIRTKLKNDLQIEHMEKQKNEELNQMKLTFFTNISHELRTPLTLILGPMDNILKQVPKESPILEPLLLIHRNSKRLFNLVNELLDFRKLETGKMTLHYRKSNFILFIHEIYKNFEEYSNGRNLKFTFFTEREEVISWFDPDVVEKILNNLISNAFKYTDDGGEIAVMVNILKADTPKKKKWQFSITESTEWVRIIVKDTGKGIPEEKIPHIFENYYRNEIEDGGRKIGSGIGLSFTKNLVDLIGGEIYVESEVGKGSRFYVKIPLIYQPQKNSSLVEFIDSENELKTSHKEAFVPENSFIKNEVPQIENEDNSTLILVVDDKEDMRLFIRYHLENKYRIIEADGGEQAIIIAHKVIPDIVICDIMMPDIDGIEVCSRLKNDDLTSHIPVILLTAKTTLEHRIEGYKTGADSYITKPFEPELLEARIYNLLESRNNLQKKYSREITLEPTQTIIASRDELFLRKMMEILEENLSDSDFGVTEMVKLLGTSRPVLYRKIKALTNLTLVEFVMQYKMKKAANILAQNQINISEVAYMLGFNDPKYFGKCFTRHFGVSPREFVKKQIEKSN